MLASSFEKLRQADLANTNVVRYFAQSKKMPIFATPIGHGILLFFNYLLTDQSIKNSVALVCERTIRPNHYLSAGLVRTFADKGCRVNSATDPHGRILAFLDRIILIFGANLFKSVLK
jgi:hypothetical protein